MTRLETLTIRLFIWPHFVASLSTLTPNTNQGINDAVDLLKMELASFGIQVKNAAQLHHSECFVGNSPCITEHPLHEVIEWKLLEQAINPFKTSAPNSLWTKLQAVIQKDFFLVIHSINLHMQEISVLCTQSIIIAEETEHNAARSLDCKTTPMLIGKLQMAEGNETLAEVKLWHSASICWG